MPPVIEMTAGWARPATKVALSGGWAMSALHAVRCALTILVLRSAQAPPAPGLSKQFHHLPEWRKFVCF